MRPNVKDMFLGSACGGGTLTAQDAVDNCLGGGPHGPFSRVFARSVPAANWNWAVRPAPGERDTAEQWHARPRRRCADAGGSDRCQHRAELRRSVPDIGGIGVRLPPQSKAQSVFAGLHRQSPTPHKLYAPFYSAYLPATCGAE